MTRAMLQPGEFLTFRVGSEDYGIDILQVQEIRSYEPPTRMANAAAFVEGVINLRGVIVPIIDLRLKLGYERSGHDSSTVVIVLKARGQVAGAVVDAVSDVIALGREQLKPAPDLGAGIDSRFIAGVGAFRSGDAERMLILIDMDALLSGTELGLAET